MKEEKIFLSVGKNLMNLLYNILFDIRSSLIIYLYFISLF